MNISSFNPHENPRDTLIMLILLMWKLGQREKLRQREVKKLDQGYVANK